MKKLTDLDPEFLRFERRGDGHTYLPMVESIEQAHGISFTCPKCGQHSIICWSRSRGVPEFADPKPGRWRLDGTGFFDLTLNAEQPGVGRSVQLNGGCGWHGFITNGEVTDA